MITSRQNPQVQYLKSLQQKKNRDRERKFIIEGWRFVEEALIARAEIEMLIFGAAAMDDDRYRRLLTLAGERGIVEFQVADNVLEIIVETEQPQGVAALVRQREPDLAAALQQHANPLLLVVDGVRDPGNLGTLIRTADAAGVTGVVLLAGTADMFNGKTLRATMGSIFHLPVQKNVALPALAELLASCGMPLMAADAAGTAPFYAVAMTGPLAIAVGSENTGVSAEIRQMSAELVNIPMPGRAESLNVSIAAGILMFEAVRQRTEIRNSTCK